MIFSHLKKYSFYDYFDLAPDNEPENWNFEPHLYYHTYHVCTSRDSYDLAVRTVTVQVKFNNSSSENLIKKYHEHEQDDYNGSTIHHKNENDKNENDTNSYGSTTHHSSNENLTNYYENDSGDGSYSNLDDYYLDDLHYLSDGSDGSVKI